MPGTGFADFPIRTYTINESNDVKTSVYIATSLDGFIARPNGDIDWLSDGCFDGGGEDYGYKTFMDSVDVLVMGHNSYEKVLTFGEWPYGDKRVVVLSSKGVIIRKDIADSVQSMSGPPAEIVRRLSRQGATHLYVDGGRTIQGFLTAGLITQFIITRIPIILGKGIPLFGPVAEDIRLRHLETHSYPSGLVQSRYEVIA